MFDVAWSDLDSSDGIFGILSANLPEVKIETDMWMRPTGVLDVVDVERLIMGQHVCFAVLVPRMQPDEVSVLFLREPLLPSVVYSLDDRARGPGGLQEVRYGPAVAEWVHGPTGLRYHVQVRL